MVRRRLFGRICGDGLLHAGAAGNRGTLDGTCVEEEEDVRLGVLEVAADKVPLDLGCIFSGVATRRVELEPVCTVSSPLTPR